MRVGPLVATMATAGMMAAACGGSAPSVGGVASVANLVDRPHLRFHNVALADDRRSVRVDFVGGREFDPADPCSVEYEGTADVVGSELVVGIFSQPHPGPVLEGQSCTQEGHSRALTLPLDAEFAGLVVRDLDGAAFLLERPPRAAAITSFPEPWRLRSEGNPSLLSPTPTWRQEWSPEAHPEAVEGASRVILFQAFGGPVRVPRAPDGIPVTVAGEEGRLHLDEETGELVLIWSIGDAELALIGYRADFSSGAFVLLAESVTISAD